MSDRPNIHELRRRASGEYRTYVSGSYGEQTTAIGPSFSRHEVVAVLDIAEAAYDLHERVEMDESVGICLSERVPSLRLAESLARVSFEETE